MKIVRGYTIDGQLLVQGHTDLVAKVGDIVRLYLDTVADSGFPEFIRATVEHPIVTKNCGTRTSYSFAYDEALLLGSAERLRYEDIVGVLVYSTQGRSVYESYLLTTDDEPPLSESAWTDTVLRGPQGPTGLTGPQGPTGATGPSGATETTASVLDKIKGIVADPTKIGAEYLPPEWLLEVIASPVPGEFDTSVQPNSLWWGRVVACDYPISMPDDTAASLGKKFIVRSTFEVPLSGAYIGGNPLTSIPAPTQSFGSTLTLFEFIGGVWRATLRYTERPVTSASALTFTPAGNLASVNVQTALQELDAEKAPLSSPAFTDLITVNTGTWNGTNFIGDQTFEQNISITGTLAVDTTITANGSITAPTVTGTTLRSITLQALTTAGIDIKNSAAESLFRVGVGGGTGIAEGTSTSASGSYSHAEGSNSVASGNISHAEGTGNLSSGFASHAEGQNTIASGSASHAQGQSTVSSGLFSHAEGTFSTASGDYSHAAGRRSKATHQGSRVLSDSQDADVNSSAINECTFRFAGGYRFLGGTMIAGAAVRLKGYTVATLPAGPTRGDTASVTDALAPAYLAVVVGGGAVFAPVIYNGTQWVTH